MSSLISNLPAADAAEPPPPEAPRAENPAPLTAGQPPQPPLRTVEALPSEAELPLELELSANELRYDGALGRVIAEGNVQAMVAGGRLLADRLEYETRSRTLFVKGNIRLQRGQQYLQASQLRYNLLEGSGEAEDVYGILDLDGNETDFDLTEAPSVPLPPAEPLACTPLLPPVPDWQPRTWALTAWGGQMIDANFGQSFLFQGSWRPESLAGLGLNKRLVNGGPFSLELDVNAIGHGANTQAGGYYNQDTPYATLPAQTFGEVTGGVGLRIWMRPWLNIFLVEGVSFNTAASGYERTFRERYSQFLNYLAFEVEALVNPQWSVVGRLHHRSGAYGVYSGVSEGSNGYLVGLRYRFGWAKAGRTMPAMPPAQGCPGAPAPRDRRQNTLTAALDRAAAGKAVAPDAGEGVPTQSQAATQALQNKGPGLWQAARAQEREREAAISRIDQRVRDVKLQQTLRVERRFGFNERQTSPDAANTYGGIKPEQLWNLNTTSNIKLVDGGISRWRFQARTVALSSTRWSAARAALSNDPYTPAQSWVDAVDLQLQFKRKDEALLTAQSSRIVLEDRLPIPARLRQRIRQNRVETPVVLGYDVVDRDGLFLGFQGKPIKVGKAGTLTVQPQLLVQRSIDGVTRSYPLPGSPPGSAGVLQGIQAGDQFGLVARWNDTRWGFTSKATLDMTTFSPQNFSSGTRSWGDLARPVTLPLLGETTARLFGAYRYRAWNGSLGEQDVYSAFGVSLEDQGQLPPWGTTRHSFYWRLGVGNFRACSSNCPSTNNSRNTSTSNPLLFPTLSEYTRTSAIGSFNSSFPLWSGKALPPTADQALISSPVPIVPGLRFDTNITGSLAYYDNSQYQNTLSFSAGPTLTLGHFSKPFLDYTQFSVTGGVTLRAGLSPLSFDRAIDLGTLNFGLLQQIAGPMLLSVGYGVNVDPASGFYGSTTGSYVELRWQRRSYDIGLYYSPYEQLGGIRVRLSDFTFKGTGVPFVPYHPSQAGLQRPF